MPEDLTTLAGVQAYLVTLNNKRQSWSTASSFEVNGVKYDGRKGYQTLMDEIEAMELKAKTFTTGGPFTPLRRLGLDQGDGDLS